MKTPRVRLFDLKKSIEGDDYWSYVYSGVIPLDEKVAMRLLEIGMASKMKYGVPNP